jgi:transketolase
MRRLGNLPVEAGKPTCLIAHTIKGKGVSFAENKPAWHHGVPTVEQLAIAAKELGVEVTW